MTTTAHNDLTPRALAILHYRQGGELADNPYPKGSDDREAYNMEMHRLQLSELKGINDELAAGI